MTTIMVSGAFPDRLNRNAGIVDCVVRGFQEELSETNQVFKSYYEVLATDVESLKPDLVIMVGSAMPDLTEYAVIRKVCDKTDSVLAFWALDDPYEFDMSYKFVHLVDVIFSNDKTAVDYYFSDKVFHLPTAADKKVHYRDIGNGEQKDLDIFFCGVGFPNRQQLIEDIEPTLLKHNCLICGDDWNTDSCPTAVNRRIETKEIADWYNRSWITLNIGRRFDKANKRFKLIPSTPGPRTFEAALAGTVQLFFLEDLEIEEYFEVGKEILVFETPTEFSQIVSELLENSEKMLNIARASQERVLREHTYTHRAARILSILSENNFIKDDKL